MAPHMPRTRTRTHGRQAASRLRFAQLGSKNTYRTRMPNQLQNQAIYATTDRTRAPRNRNAGPTIPTRRATRKAPTVTKRSARPWRRDHRGPLVAALRARGSLECAARRSPKCLGTITNPSDLVAGHTTPLSQGGRHIVQPECRPCSDFEGGQLTHAAQKAQQSAPERRW